MVVRGENVADQSPLCSGHCQIPNLPPFSTCVFTVYRQGALTWQRFAIVCHCYDGGRLSANLPKCLAQCFFPHVVFTCNSHSCGQMMTCFEARYTIFIRRFTTVVFLTSLS